MIFVTGDCHADFHKFSTVAFYEQTEMTKDDIVIILGDFGGIWNADGESAREFYWLKWLNQKPFTTVFVDGNHENFDRLNSEYEVVDFHGGKAHKIRNSIYHLMRGEIFNFEGLRFFAFGGASSHDINDGILSLEDFDTEEDFKQTFKLWVKQNKLFRVNHLSWWEEELPSDVEIQNAESNLKKVDYKVDYVLSHCAPQSVVAYLYMGTSESDKLTLWFEDLQGRLDFKKWFFGHYHEDKKILDKYILLYDQIVRIK
jgi:hypothetical protein